MTRSDKWRKPPRPCVARYFAFRDEVKRHNVQMPDCGAHVTFIIPMPESWSRKKKEAMNQRPHQQRGDIDNIVKALLDSVFDDDCAVWDIRATKVWGYTGAIEIDA